MKAFDDFSRSIARLDEREFARLERREKKMRKLLRNFGMSKKETRRSVHRDIRDVTTRGSAVSRYEAIRAEHILKAAIRVAGLTETGGVAFTVSLLRHRLPVGELSSYSPTKALRKFTEALRKLRDMDLNVVGFAVFEVDLCCPPDSDPFYEPHLHGAIWGASEEQVGKAFVIRKLAKGAVRNRPKHVTPLNDLNGWIGYVTKLDPQLRFQAVKSERGVWSKSRLPDADAHEWRLFMSRYRVRELIRFHGIDDGNLGVDGVAELTGPSRHLSRGRPKMGHKGPSRPRQDR